MDRKRFQELSKIRLKEAETLLKLGMPDGAYYLAGYAVECALKACISKSTRRYEFPERKKVDLSHSHNLPQLMKVAELEGALREQVDADPQFGRNWELVQSWSEQARYRRHSADSAHQLCEAVSHRKHGIFVWIKQRW